MIYALNDQDERINASKAEKGKIYYCPNLECKNRELIVKRGEIRIPHFAHKSLKDCSSEPESEAHLACKMFFQSLLNLDNQYVEYYGIEGVRPDVLYDQFALEIQCSPIAVKEVKRRNKIYEKNGYIAIWIFLNDEFLSIKKIKIPPIKSEWEKKLDRHGISWRPEDFIRPEPTYRINYRVKKPVLRGSYQGLGGRHFKFFSFKYDNENEEIQVCYNEYAGIEYWNEFTKENELIINAKQYFDTILEEILTLIKNKDELRDLTKKLNSLPKQIQGNLYQLLNLNNAHITGRNFYDGLNNFEIGMFLDQVFYEKKWSMEEFKDHLEKMLIEAYSKDKSFKDWRNQNTIERNGKKYVPLCRLQKINHETPNAYLVFFDEWIPKSLCYRDDKYLYCVDWMYKKIENGSNKQDYYSRDDNYYSY